MFTCIESSYGTFEWVSAAALKVSKRQPTVAYGKEYVRDGEAGLRSMCEALNPPGPGATSPLGSRLSVLRAELTDHSSTDRA